MASVIVAPDIFAWFVAFIVLYEASYILERPTVLANTG